MEDIDFENYAVSDERTQFIRDAVAKVKTQSWALDLKVFVEARGTNDNPDAESPALPGLEDSKHVKYFRWPESSPLNGAMAILNGNDLSLYFERQSLLELSFLPKQDEYMVPFVAETPEAFEKLEFLMTQLQNESAQIKEEKRQKQAAFQAKFRKN